MPIEREPGVGDFPARTVTILSLCMTLNIYTLVSLFPYVGFMVQDLLGLETTNESGFYAGYVASAFTFGRFVTSYSLGQVTDSVGRKPVIIAGLLSIMVFSLAFGLSPTFGFAVSSRLILGLTNGMVPALRTTLREVCGQEHILQGMTYFGGCKAFSLVLGTAMGGLLAQPATNYPGVFSDTGFFGTYPYLLPNLAGSIGALILLPLVVLYMPETRDFGMQQELQESSDCGGATTEHVPKIKPDLTATSGRSKGAGKASSAYASMADDNDGEGLSRQREGSLSLELQQANSSKNVDETNGVGGRGDFHVKSENMEPGLWGPDGLLAVPHVKLVLFVVCLLEALVIGFEEAYPLWALSTPDVGGLGWGTIDIGKVFLVSGVIVAVLQLIVFPKLVKVVGITIWQRVGCLMCIPSFVAIPNAKAFGWNDSSLFMVSVATTTFVYCFQGMVVLVLSIASTSMVQPDMRGKLGGLYNMSESLGRFLGPVGFATLFAWSISPSADHWVDHQFVFFVAAASMALVAVLAWGTFTPENMMTPAERSGGVDVPVVCKGGNGQKEGSSGTFARSGRESDLV